MSASAQQVFYPERCDHCGRCLRVCRTGALKVGSAYISIDRERCDSCNECVDICDRGAIVPRPIPARPTASRPGVSTGEGARVAVGSRAEAKALRKAATAAEKPAAQPRPSGVVQWTFADVAAVLAVVVSGTLGKNALLGLHAVELMPEVGRAAARAVVLAVYYAVQLGAFAFLTHRHGSSLFQAFGLRRAEGALPAEKPGAFGSAALVAALFVGAEVFSIGYGLTMEALGWAQPHRLPGDLSSVFGGGGVGIALSALLVALAAPFVEELAFRGVVLSALSERWGMWGAIVASSAVYAAFHFSAWMFAPTMVLGIALAWLTQTRRSLVPAIALHVLYNAAAVTAAFLVAR